VNPRTSLYLDAIRFIAALVVFLCHAKLPYFSTGVRWFPSFGYEMVIVFFVLSGFVIAYTAERKARDWRIFAAERLSRLYSVALPALILTAILDLVGRRWDSTLYEELAPSSHYWERIGLSVAFLQQSGNLGARPGSNGPYWSLAYEFWYYAGFAALFYPCSLRSKVCVCIVVLIAMTPKILLLMPIWLSGVACYHICRRGSFPKRWAPPVSISSFTLIAAALTGVIQLPFSAQNLDAVPPLFFSGRFAEANQLGILIALHFISMDAWMRGASGVNRSLQAVVRFFANRTFSLYLFHAPILVFCRAFIPYDSASNWQVYCIVALIFIVILGLSEITEMRRQWWRGVFYRLFRVASVEP